MIEFQEFAKIPRYRRELCITEKIDGTNAAVVWVPATLENSLNENIIATRPLKDGHGNDAGMYHLLAQSRSKFITPARVKAKNDNFSFAQWVDDHSDELMLLGPGAHFGEWWGYGVQRGYGLTEKRFSLFNVNRWGEGRQTLPPCCHVVPLLGYVQTSNIQSEIDKLICYGSVAAPGFMAPEGVVIWHSQSKNYYKILIEGDDIPKGQKTATEAV